MKHDVELAALGSGSKGNAFVIRKNRNAILIDGGFSRKELCLRMVGSGIDPGSIKAVLLTHEHDDHVKGCRVFCDQFDIPLYATCRTVDHLRNSGKLPSRVRLFEPGSSFELAGFGVASFSVPHDAVDPVGFSISCDGFKLGVATDLGRMSPLVAARLAGSDALIIESNYDQDMLMNSARELSLKRRIRGPFGHLDNIDAAAALPSLLSANTTTLLLAHVSSECNSYELVEKIGRQVLESLGRDDIFLAVVRQHEAMPLIML